MALAGSISRKSNVRRNRPYEDLAAKKSQKTIFNRKANGPFFIRLSTTTWVVISLFVLAALLTAVNSYQQNIACLPPSISVLAEGDNHFMVEEEVLAEVRASHGDVLEGTPMGLIDLHRMEADLEKNLLVENAEVHRNMMGGLFVDVEMKEALVRVMNLDGSDFYLDMEGNKFPTTRTYAAHVLLARGNFEESLTPVDSFECVTLEAAIPFFKFVHEDPFWNAFISEVSIRQDGELVLYPQLGSAPIEFGHPVDIEEKFNNLRLFYDQVIAKVGWKKYRRLSLEYRNQVVATRRK